MEIFSTYDKVFEWVIIFLGISGIVYGIYRGFEEGIGSAFFGFFGVLVIGGAAIGIILPVWWAFLNPKAVANYIPFFGWFCVSTGYAFSIFMGIYFYRTEKINKALTILFVIPFFYISLVTVIPVIGMLAMAIIAIPISIFHACVGTGTMS